MRVLVNALSVNNQSGRHVLMGHMNRLRDWTEGTHDYVFLFHDANRDIVVDLPGYQWVECPASTSRWSRRALWEYRNLNKIARQTHSDFIFTPAGVSVPGIKTPQVVFCQNPWCMVPELHHGLNDKFKAWLQRRGYRRTMRESSLMVFNSQYMHDAYRLNAGGDAKRAMVVYQAISETTWEAARRWGKSLLEKNHIVSVSAMAPHKGADVLVRAFRLVRDTIADARLTFAGGWPDPSHRRQIENLVKELGLSDAVTFCGWISDEELQQLYSRAHVFSLLSRCESFGIPAIEAQSFGTPAIGTDTCAIPEIGGDGGVYSPVDDVEAAAANLVNVLTNEDLWSRLSDRASENARRFCWTECSRPLLQMFDIVNQHAEA
ncbi:glycosyltransferase family 4 protein [Planctomycetes bacterium TBK1r]|uniref:Mannosylfructose-phosphate synthase n=1 Tax=Stieleria magnilauensis TaxID=2527963 RepID=A0ABX5XLX6_9BACT|nr:Mannosylfructose-phosphate synthase [Planctomycetes bacterium TBK1r]